MVVINNLEASVLARLKNKSKEQNIPLQQLLNLFCQEEFIRRLSVSKYNKNLILKGGFLLYSISGFTSRATVDADYLLKNYSNDLESIEKLDAIIVLMEATGCMKDFYDIYYLATTFDFEGRKLQEAIYETLSNRGTPHEEDSITIIKRLTDDKEIKRGWDNFCKKILKYELDFNHVVDIIIVFISSPYDAMIKENELFKNWDYKNKMYI